MPTLPTTKAGIEALPRPVKNAVDYKDPRQRGLFLRVTRTGAMSWAVRVDRDGKSNKLAIGRFPDLPISLAREKAAKLLGDLAQGVDVVAQKASVAEAAQKRLAETVETVGRIYIAKTETGRHRFNGKPMRPRPRALEADYLERVIVPRIGKRPLADLTRAEVQQEVDRIEADLSAGAARHARNVLQKIFAYATWQEIVASDPTRYVSAPGWTERERVLADDELRAVWTGLTTSATEKGVSVSPAIADAIKLAAVTLQRRGEVIGMRLDEIDRAAKTWTMAGERTKNGRTHVVPLSPIALELIDHALSVRSMSGKTSAFVFPSPRDPTKAVEPNAMTHAWGRFLPALRRPARPGEAGEKCPVEGITLHDLRRTGATAITSERIGMPRFVVSQVLNHTSDTGGTAAVTAVYDRNAYMREKRAALDAWAAVLIEIVEGKERPDNVVQMARG